MSGPKKQLFFVTAVICAFTALMLAVIIPNTIKPQSGVNPIGVCRNNLRQIEGAMQEWMLENHKKLGDVITEREVKLYVKLDAGGNLPKCPSGGTYVIERLGENPICSYHGYLLGTNSP